MNMFTVYLHGSSAAVLSDVADFTRNSAHGDERQDVVVSKLSQLETSGKKASCCNQILTTPNTDDARYFNIWKAPSAISLYTLLWLLRRWWSLTESLYAASSQGYSTLLKSVQLNTYSAYPLYDSDGTIKQEKLNNEKPKLVHDKSDVNDVANFHNYGRRCRPSGNKYILVTIFMFNYESSTVRTLMSSI